MKLINIDPLFGVANSTGQGKCLAIKPLFVIGMALCLCASGCNSKNPLTKSANNSERIFLRVFHG
jgi:hypothetical protein